MGVRVLPFSKITGPAPSGLLPQMSRMRVELVGEILQPLACGCKDL